MQYYLATIVGAGLVYWALRVGLLLRRKTTFKTFWLAYNARTEQQNEILYIALGDSTAQGLGASTPRHSYPMIVRDWLQIQTGRPVRLINVSVSGAKVQDVASTQLPLVARYQGVQVVTLAVGANDIFSFDPESFKRNVLTIVRALPKGSFVATIPTFVGRMQKHDWKVQAANQIIQDAVKDTNHHVIDLYKTSQTANGFLYGAADLFHPNGRAYKKWAEAFQESIQPTIEELKH